MTERYPDRRRYSAVVALCLWAALLVVGALFPGARLWGVHLIAFLSPAMKISVGLLFALACVYTFNPGGIADRLASITGRLGRGWWRGLLLVVMVGGGGWLLRAREALLGDGTLRANDAMIGSGWYPSELIPTALATWLTRGLPESWGIDGYSAVGLVSIVGGVVFAAGLWWLVPRAARDSGRGAIFFILTCGAVRLFAGYVESYALGFAFSAFWMLAMIAWLRGRVHWRVFVAFWVLAQLSHVTAVVLVPATLYALWCKKERVGLAVFAVCVLTVGGTVLYFFRQLQVSALGVGEAQFLVPFLPQPPHAYGIVSPAHWLDIVNHLFLLAPALAVAVLAALFSRRREQSTDVTVGHLHDSRIFYALAVALPLCAAFLIDPKLGWARDWDLFALLSAPALVAAALWLSAQAGALRRVAAATAVVSCVLWLTFSVDGRAERDRFEVLLDMDPSRSDYGHEIMGQYYRRQQNPEKVIEHYQKALLVSENARYRLNIAAAHMELGEYVEAERWYLGVAGRDSTIGPAWVGASFAQEGLGKFVAARASAARALQLEPDNPLHNHQYGKTTLIVATPDSAYPFLDRAVTLKPDEPAYLHGLGVCLRELGRLAEARVALTEAIRRNPTNPIYLLDAARVALRMGDATVARQMLERHAQLGSRHTPVVDALYDSLATLTATP